MAKVTQASDVSNVSGQADFATYSSRTINNLTNVVNGNLDFVNNFNCQLRTVTFINPGEDVKVTHTLGRTAIGYLIINSTVQGWVNDGDSKWTTATIYLKAEVLGSVQIIII